jgi:LysR family transcriptional regulator, nitrogen assimilation regulatory protein
MELRQVRYFVGVCEAGSLLKASARLHVAQPALGQQMSDLEHHLGAKLFVRTSRGMVPTDAGRQFLEHAKVLLADVERARSAVRELTSTPQGDVVIGLPTTVALAVTVPLLQACRERYPHIRLKIVEAYSGFLGEWLRSGRLDSAILFGDAPEVGLAKEALLDEQLALVTTPGGRALPKQVPLKRLVHWPLILPGREHGLRRIIDEACAAESLTLDVVAEIDSLTSVKRAVEAGVGSTVLSLASVSEEVRMGRLQAATISSASTSRRVVCATHMARPSTVAGTAATRLLTDAIRGMVQTGTWPARLV